MAFIDRSIGAIQVGWPPSLAPPLYQSVGAAKTRESFWTLTPPRLGFQASIQLLNIESVFFSRAGQ